MSVYKPSNHTRNQHSTATNQQATRLPTSHDSAGPNGSNFRQQDNSFSNNNLAVITVEAHGHPEDFPKEIADGRYRILRKIGEGSFGVIFLALDGRSQNVKEHRKCSAPQLRDEFRTYTALKGCPGVPQVHYYGQEGDYYCLVMDLLGASLEEIFDACGRRFTVPCVCQIVIQMVMLIRSIHDRGMIYRDIKPDNFLIGAHDPSRLYLIDFGMAKYFKDPKTDLHIPYKERKSLSGTARYMSINTHLGREQSRRDDLESIGHVMFYLLRGSLPWQGLKAATNKEKYERIGAKKQATPIRELSALPLEDNLQLPWEFGRFLEYCRELPFEADPDYTFLVNLMRSVMKGYSHPTPPPLDWVSHGVALPNPSSATPSPAKHHHASNGAGLELPPLALRQQPPRVEPKSNTANSNSRQHHRPWYRRVFCLG